MAVRPFASSRQAARGPGHAHRDGSIAAGFGVKSYSNLWLIDPQGRIAGHHVGYGEDSLESIISEIKRLLTEELARQQAKAAG